MHFMPCAVPVHRREPMSSIAHRCEMIELAISSQNRFILNRLEVERDGPSFSIDSLRAMKLKYDDQIVLLLGSDAFNSFENWKDPDEILRLAGLVVCHRPGVFPDADLFVEHRVDSVDRFSSKPDGAILSIEVDANQCSSTEIRRQIASGKYNPACIHSDVASYIKQHNLYGNSVDR
jgi:nicotinate-nucleotide adenylyltransferase